MHEAFMSQRGFAGMPGAAGPEPARRSRPTFWRYAVLGTGCVLAIITYIHRAGFQANSKELLGELGMDIRDLGYMTVAFMVAYGLFEVPWGRLGDRFGGRALLLWIVLGGSILTASVAAVTYLPRIYAVQLGFLLIARFVFGLFQAGTFPVLARLVSDWIPSGERGLAQGLIWMSSRAGGMLAPFLMVWLFAVLGGWRMPLVAGAALGVIWCVGVIPWLRNRPEQMPRVNDDERALIARGRAGETDGGLSAGHVRAPWGVMLRSSNVWALWMMYGFLGFSGNFFLFLFTDYLRDYRFFDKETAKWLSMVPFAFGIPACVLGGAFSDWIGRVTGNRRLGRRVVGMAGLSFAGVMILITPWVSHVVVLGLLFGLAFAGNDLSMGPAWAAAGDIGGRHAGTIAGAMNMTASMMAALEAILAGQLFHAAKQAADRGDTAAHQLLLALPFVFFAVSYFLGALCWLRVDVTETVPQGEGD